MVEPWGPDSVRVRAALGGPVTDTDWALLPQEASSGVERDCRRRRRDADPRRDPCARHAREFYDGQVEDSRSRCRLEFFDRRGTLLCGSRNTADRSSCGLVTSDPSPAGPPPTRVVGRRARREALRHGAVPAGPARPQGLDLRAGAPQLAGAACRSCMSSAGYGFLWHNPAIGRATFAANRTEWSAESTRQLDYWVTAGATPARRSAPRTPTPPGTRR